VFHESASIITDAAAEMQKAYAVPKKDFIEGAVNLGRFGKAAGASEADAAKLGVNLAKLAADLGSIENIDTATAVQRMSAAMAGETEVLRKHGVMMTEATIRQEALDKGWIKGKEELDEHTKIMARASLIFKDLKDAQGDLARTIDSPANAMRSFQGTIDNFATEVGQVFLPVLSAAAVGGRDLMQSIGEMFRENQDTITSWGGWLKSAFDEVSMVVRNFGSIWKIAQLQITEVVGNVIAQVDAIMTNMGLLAEYVAGNWRQVLTDAFTYVSTVLKNLAGNAGGLIGAVKDAAMGKGWSFEWTDLTKGFVATMAELPTLAQPALVDLSAEIGAEMDKIFAGEQAHAAGKGPKVGAAPLDMTIPEFEKGVGKAADDKAKKEKAAKEAPDVGALTLGSKESMSAIARFRNEDPSGKAIEKTAAASEESAKSLKNIEKALGAGVLAGAAAAGPKLATAPI
jgi:hypothetical protein